MKTHFIENEAYQAALNDDFHAFIEVRGKAILSAINKVCRINDQVPTMNSNLDENDQEVLLDGEVEEDLR